MLLQIHSVTKSYHRKPVIKDVTFSLGANSRTGLTGENGSGKTTLMKMLAGIIYPETGDGKLLHYPLFTSDFHYRKHLIFWSHDPMFYPALSGIENLELFLSLRGQKNSINKIMEYSERFGLGSHIQQPVREYSVGQIQKLKLVQFSISDWQLALLDEPTAGMDKKSIKLLEGKLSEWENNNKSILMTSHQQEWLDNWTDRVFTIQDSKLQS